MNDLIHFEMSYEKHPKPMRQKLILDALDKLDINEATVYKDYDNIAKYIVGKSKLK